MTLKKFVKAFIAGLAFPAVFLPLAYTLLFFVEHTALRTHSLQFIPMYIPIVFGITNALYIHIGDGLPNKSVNAALWAVGGCLGFVVAVLGVFFIHVPSLVFGSMLDNDLVYMPLIVLPIVYGFIFRYIIKWLNKLLAI